VVIAQKVGAAVQQVKQGANTHKITVPAAAIHPQAARPLANVDD